MGTPLCLTVHGGGCSCMAMEKPWSMVGGLFVCILAQMGVEHLLVECNALGPIQLHESVF